VIAIGGIGPENAATVLRAGASGIAVVRAVWGADDPLGAAAGLLEILPEAGGPGGPVEGGV
jgi:thiamine-phosphate pyrophosphorylase